MLRVEKVSAWKAAVLRSVPARSRTGRIQFKDPLPQAFVRVDKPQEPVMHHPLLLSQHVVLLGLPSQGKSAYARAVARAYAGDANAVLCQPRSGEGDEIPVFLRARDFLGSEFKGDFIEAVIASGRGVFVVDGLNEAPNQDARVAICAELRRIREAAEGKNRILLTTRPAVEIPALLTGFESFNLLGLKPDGLERFMAEWFYLDDLAFENANRKSVPMLVVDFFNQNLRSKLARRQIALWRDAASATKDGKALIDNGGAVVQELARNPLLFSMMCARLRGQMFDRGTERLSSYQAGQLSGIKLPSNLPQLVGEEVKQSIKSMFDKIMHSYAGPDEERAKFRDLERPFLLVIRDCALSLFEGNGYEMKVADLRSKLVEAFSSRNSKSPLSGSLQEKEAIVNSLIQAAIEAAIFEPSSPERIAFSHLVIQEYYAAEKLAVDFIADENASTAIIQKIADPRWANVFLFFVYLIGSSDIYAPRLAKLGRDLKSSGLMQNPKIASLVAQSVESLKDYIKDPFIKGLS